MKLKIFKFFCIDSASVKSSPPNFAWSCLALWPELVSDEKNSIWEILQNLEFWHNWNAVNVYIFGPYRGPIYCWKTKIFAKTASFAIINNISPRSQKNHRILAKLSRKTFFGFKLGLHYQHGSKSHHKLLYSLNRTIHLYFLDVKFQIVIICCFRL